MNRIKRIEVENFKSFESLKVDLNPFNILIGANASGKSNFTQIFKFIRDISRFGIDNAISMQGGAEYLRNLNIGAKKELSIKVTYLTGQDETHQTIFHTRYNTEVSEVTYDFSMKLRKGRYPFSITKDKVALKFNIYNKENPSKVDNIIISFAHEKNKIIGPTILKDPKNQQLENFKKDVLDRLYNRYNHYPRHIVDKKTLLLQIPLYIVIPLVRYTSFGFIRSLSNFSIYDFDPKLSQKAIPITGKIELEEDGSNLAIVLKNIMQDKEKKRRLLDLIKMLLPFIESLSVDNFAGTSLIFKLKEKYFKKQQYLPASLISDGTINITALIIALYFSRRTSLTIIEEPERGIHPYLISKIVKLMKEVSKKKQIIVTTHNPEMINHVKPEDILLAKRNSKGYSQIIKPADDKFVKEFLENEMSLGDLYIQNLLGD